MATKLHDPCREKAADDEPIFTLRAQDISAPLVVEFWVHVQQLLRKEMDLGCTPSEIITSLERGHSELHFPGGDVPIDSKLGEALATAEWMRRWAPRKQKVAD